MIFLQYTYNAFVKIAKVANSKTLHKNYAISIYTFISAAFIFATARVILKDGSGIGMIFLVFIAISIACTVWHIKSYVELAKVTGVKLFIFVVLLMVATILADRIFGVSILVTLLLGVVTFAFQIIAWMEVKLDKIRVHEEV